MSEISEKVTKIGVNYLGPAAKTFFERQTKAHMGGLPFDEVEKDNLLDLSKWVNISGSLIIQKDKAKELADKIAALS